MYKGLTQSYKVHLNYHIIIFFMLEKIKKNLGNNALTPGCGSKIKTLLLNSY